MTGPARATARDGQPVFRIFIFRGSYGDFRSLRTTREAGLWGMRRLKGPGHSDCAQIATWWPSDDAMARVPREVPRDRGARVHTPSPLPRSPFWQPPPGCGPGRPLGSQTAVSGVLRLQVRDLSTRGQYAAPAAASPARVGQVPTPPGLQLTASAAEPFERQARRCEPRKPGTFSCRPSRPACQSWRDG